MKKKLIIIAGPTASGKTDLAIQIPKYLNTEIISADSRQCYCELNIGVAKPSDEQLSTIPHHFINSHSIHDEVSAGIFERYALKKLDEIFIKKDIAICVGGTGLYIDALCEGIDFMPETDPDIYKKIEVEYKIKGIQWLQQEIKIHDEAFFTQGEIHNPSRLLRALSFKVSTGASILDFRKRLLKKRDFDIDKFSIDIDRSVLYQRINDRVNLMMTSGLLDEVNQLQEWKNLKSLNTVGYNELFGYFAKLLTLDQAVEKIKQHSRNYAKRQITWFKNKGDYQLISSNEILKQVHQMNLI